LTEVAEFIGFGEDTQVYKCRRDAVDLHWAEGGLDRFHAKRLIMLLVLLCSLDLLSFSLVVGSSSSFRGSIYKSW
jgi:hypothetical protein